MRRPGERRIEIAAAWAARLFFVADSMNLGGVSWAPRRRGHLGRRGERTGRDTQLERVGQQQLRHYNRGSLEVDRLPAIVFEVVDPEHGAIDEARDLGQHPLEVGEEGRVVQRPFRGALDVPLAQRQAVGYGEPIPVDLEVGGLAGSALAGFKISGGRAGKLGGEWRDEERTYYAGNSRILKPAAMKAHCAMEGYGSLMAASGGVARAPGVVLMCGGLRGGREGRRDVGLRWLFYRGSAGGCLRYGLGGPVLRALSVLRSSVRRQGPSGTRIVVPPSYCRLPHTGNDEWTELSRLPSGG